MHSDIKKWCKECLPCQSSKVTRHTKPQFEQINPGVGRLEYCHIDIVGPLSPCTPPDSTYPSEYRYLVTCIDRVTRWVEVIPVKDITAKTIAFAFLNGWISRLGVPLFLVSDRGSQFTSEIFKELSEMIGFHRIRITSYHP